MKLTDYTALIGVFVTLVSAAVAFLTWATNLAKDRKQSLAQRRAEAYIDYLTGLSRVSNIADADSKEYRDADIMTLEAKHRIILYGAEEVVEGLRELYEGPAQFALTKEGRRRYADLLNAMRKDSGQPAASQEAIERLLMNKSSRESGPPSLEP